MVLWAMSYELRIECECLENENLKKPMLQWWREQEQEQERQRINDEITMEMKLFGAFPFMNYGTYT